MIQVTDELIELRGLRFHFRDWEGPSDNAPTLVLLHGYTGHARSWDRFASAMAKTYRVLALDQRGHGETEWARPAAYGTLEMIQDLHAFVRAMQLTNYSLLGLSMGGLVSIGFAGERPPGLERLVIVDIAPEIAPGGLERIGEGVSRSDVFESRDEAFERAQADNPTAPSEHLRARVDASLMRTGDGRWTYRYDRLLRDSSVPRERLSAAEGWRRAANIAAPTLLVRGELSDILDRPTADRMVEKVPDCQLAEVTGAGHSVPLDKPDEFEAAVAAFL